MANHKYKKTKSGRAGCLFCKPWKGMGNSKKMINAHIEKQRQRLSD